MKIFLEIPVISQKTHGKKTQNRKQDFLQPSPDQSQILARPEQQTQFLVKQSERHLAYNMFVCFILMACKHTSCLPS